MEDLEADVQQLTACQGRLRGFILASLGNYADTADVLQRTNLILWKKAAEFTPEADFVPWALSIARYEILAFRRDSHRDRHVFSDDVTNLMLESAASEVADHGERTAALRRCLEKLPRRNRDLLSMKYGSGKTIRELARDAQRSEDSIKSLLLRIRKSLERCIESKLRLNLE